MGTLERDFERQRRVMRLALVCSALAIIASLASLCVQLYKSNQAEATRAEFFQVCKEQRITTSTCETAFQQLHPDL